MSEDSLIIKIERCDKIRNKKSLPKQANKESEEVVNFYYIEMIYI